MKLWSSLLCVLCIGCVAPKEIGLYDVENNDTEKNINGFTQLSIFKDDMNADVWFTKNATCLMVKSEQEQKYAGKGAMKIQWNKQAGGCPWLGLGIGWDGWSGKDLSQIHSTAAISFRVRTDDKPMNQLPWAIGLEDFNGAQQWTGCTADVVVNGPIGKDWTQIVVPLTKFNLENSAMDMYSVKQLMLQFESSGTVMIDEIEIIPWVQK